MAVLCVPAAVEVGAWVLVVGAMRYVSVAASWFAPALRGALPRSDARRLVAAVQGPALLAAVAPVVPPVVGAGAPQATRQ